MSWSHAGLATSTFLASAVELVEAFTIVLAMGLTRGWRSTLWGVGAALGALTVDHRRRRLRARRRGSRASALQLGIGTLLLIFGLQWLRKAILRSSGLKALHDEEEIFLAEQRGRAAGGHGPSALGLDWFAFTVAFKGVFLEGLEVVFIVITFGLNADAIALAAAGAIAAGGDRAGRRRRRCTGRSPGCRRTRSRSPSACCSRPSARSGRPRASASSPRTASRSSGPAATSRCCSCWRAGACSPTCRSRSCAGRHARRSAPRRVS